MIQRLRLALTLPPDVVLRRAAGLATRRVTALLARRRDMARPTYGPAPTGELRRLMTAPPREALAAHAHWLRPLAALYRRGWFDLLGSGWVRPTPGMKCAGFENSRRPAAAPDPINVANRTTSEAVRALISSEGVALDWQLDFKSGHRWSEARWSGDITFGDMLGADVKVPWELARMQHLPILAWSYALDGNQADARAFRDQVLDFIAANPPRFGVNWRCTMDVAIRAANWVVAFDLFRAAGHTFDSEFERVLAASLADHGRHIVTHLEWYPEGRGNHYLADICGLAFIAALLPAGAESDAWLAFAAQELQSEAAHQVLPDGAGFEASTAYHRLSGEMIVYTAALLAGLDETRREAVRRADPRRLSTRPRRPLSLGPDLEFAGLRALIGRMAAFTRAATKPDGRIVQIGDNDSGRFLRPHPVVIRRTAAEARRLYANLDGWNALADDDVYWDEDLLDHRPFVAAAEVFSGQGDGGLWLDGLLIRLMGGEGGPSPAHRPAGDVEAVPPSAKDPGRRIRIQPGGAPLDVGLESLAFPDFGLFVLRSSRVWLAVRCGPIGLNGRGGHAHNDQLAVEIMIDGEDWLRDPGSFVYTADRRWRNAYRSVTAHAAPRLGRAEPGRLDLGDFWLGDEAKAQCLGFGLSGFSGRHGGFGEEIRRDVRIAAEAVIIEDFGGETGDIRVGEPAALRALFPCAVPFSPGYGRRLRQCDS